MVELFANSGDPGQTPRSAASDQGLHCLPFIRLGVSILQWVKNKEKQSNQFLHPQSDDHNVGQPTKHISTAAHRSEYVIKWKKKEKNMASSSKATKWNKNQYKNYRLRTLSNKNYQGLIGGMAA